MSIVEVNCENLDSNPECPHGPTLKFSRQVKEKLKSFYACSAYRDRKDCPFFLWEGEKITKSKELALQEWKLKLIPEINHEEILKRQEQFKKMDSSCRQFCTTCFDFVFPSENKVHKCHTLRPIKTVCELKQPSKILFPFTKNKGEAQFWFSRKTLTFILSNIERMKIDKVLCIGTPTLHEHLVNMCKRSLLLDIDHRYHWFYDDKEFIWFNMFNFHFFGDKNRSLSTLIEFLGDGSALVVIDPPFGARTEPLRKTIKLLQDYANERLKIFVVLPYFMEPQVLLSFPIFCMLDFPIEYENHKKFKDKSNSKLSPVRIFTNVTPRDFIFPSNEGYYFCVKCKAWRSKLNKHCDKCKICPSKNGASYKHCSVCDSCVKLTWEHCNVCNKCTLPDHNCKRKGSSPLSKKKKYKH